MSNYSKFAKKVQFGAGCSHELPGVSIRVYFITGTVVAGPEGYDGTLESIYLVQTALYDVFPLYID